MDEANKNGKAKTAKTAKDTKTAFDVAASYIANRPRTIAETRAKLKEKGYDSEEIESAIASMIDYNYLDDYSYCMAYFRYAYSKQRGRRRIIRELMEKGVDRDLIAQAYDDFCDEEHIDEYAMALEIARGELRSALGQSKLQIDEKLVARIGRKLDSRGFAMDDIYKLLAEIRRWKDIEDIQEQ